jgi:hsp70-interacting protein
MNDPGLNTLLKWSIENSAVSDTAEPTQPRTQLNPELLAQLMGGPSDADRMISSMQAIHDPSVDHENKGIAWDNFEQLVENLDNANNMEALKLWTPLCEMLESEEKQDREMACWCLGTAVQNNIKCQERVSFCCLFPHIAGSKHADFLVC